VIAEPLGIDDGLLAIYKISRVIDIAIPEVTIVSLA
jgi:hypothetical protein